MWHKKLAENPEHVPLLVTPAAAASKHQKQSATATTINIPNNPTNGGLIDNSDHHRPVQISPVMLSSGSPAHVMRSRLNQYKAGVNNIVVNFDADNGSTISTTKVSSAKTKKKKKSADI